MFEILQNKDPYENFQKTKFQDEMIRFWYSLNPRPQVSGLPKVIFLAVAETKGEGGKTSALKVEAEGEAEGLVFSI